MKKLLPIVLLFTFMFAAQNQTECEPFTPIVNTDGDAITTPNPLLRELAQAKMNGDLETYHQLLEAYTNQLPGKSDNAPSLYAEKVDPPVPVMRYGNDIVIYNGDVFYNEWAMTTNIDDEAISVDYHRGDTLVAAVACGDSLLRVFKSYDNGMNWSYVYWLSAAGGLSEPEVIYGSNGLWYHVLARAGSGNGNLVYYNVEGDEGSWNGNYIEGSADSVHRFSMCSDRTDYSPDYWLYVAYHQGCGGIGEDQIVFTIGKTYGTSWTPWDTIQFTGSMFPDLAYGDDNLYLTRMYQQVSDDKRIYCRVSTDLGSSWESSVLIEQDSVTKQGPQIAASTDGSEDAWVIFPRRDPSTANNDYGLRWSWTKDGGTGWSSPGWVNSNIGDMEVLPGIAVCDQYGSDSWYPYVTFINSVDDWSNPTVNNFYWLSDSSWYEDDTYSDHTPEFVRPIQTWEADGGLPAFAYVGSGGQNVYYDSWSNTGIVENTKASTSMALLSPNRPNPFTSNTRIAYSVPVDAKVSLRIYNTLGQEVTTLVNEYKTAGSYGITWNGADNHGAPLPKGIYFLRLETGVQNATRKVIIE